MPRAEPEGKSKLLQWMLAFFFVFQVITLVQTLLNLAAPLLAADFLTAHTPVAIGINCMMILAWVTPILAILLLALKRGRRYTQEVAHCAIAALADFGLKFLLGIAWMVVVLPAILKSVSAAPGRNSSAMTAQVIADNLVFFYSMQVLVLLITLASSGFVLAQLRKMNGIHFRPAAEVDPPPPEEETDLGDATGWDDSHRKPPHDRHT